MATVRRPPESIDRLLIGTGVLHNTLYGLSLAREREGLCYWIGASVSAGSDGRSRAAVQCVAFPQIESSYSHFRLRNGQMGLISEWCADHGLWILAQVHTHPTDEPHSEADECWPASRRAGFLSVVIPYFAQLASLRQPGWRGYEIQADGLWRDVDVATRFEILPDVWVPATNPHHESDA